MLLPSACVNVGSSAGFSAASKSSMAPFVSWGGVSNIVIMNESNWTINELKQRSRGKGGGNYTVEDVVQIKIVGRGAFHCVFLFTLAKITFLRNQ